MGAFRAWRGSFESASDLKDRTILAARWAVLGMVTLSTVAAVVLAWSPGPARSDSSERYACPMHPDVRAVGPRECPICRMALERAPVSRAAESGGMGAASMAPEDATGYTVRQVTFTDNIRSPAWVETTGNLIAHLYADELAVLGPGARGVFTPAASPSAAFDARMTTEPPSSWDCCTLRVHFQVNAVGPWVRQGTTGWLRFAGKLRRATLIPSSAVLESDNGSYVLIATGQRTTEPRLVRLGKVFFGNAVILSGLQERDSIATNGLFFLDAERRLRHDVHDRSVVSAR
jgi:hypothetical protein